MITCEYRGKELSYSTLFQYKHDRTHAQRLFKSERLSDINQAYVHWSTSTVRQL